MTSRISLVEQKKLQWAREREEMAKLNEHSESPKIHQPTVVHTNIRTYPTNARLSSRETNGIVKNKPLRAFGNYGSTSSLQSVVDQNSTHTTTSLRTIDFSTGSLINLLEGTDFSGSTRQRSPSLPPINTKDNHQQLRHTKENTKELGIAGSRYCNQVRPQKQNYRQPGRNEPENPYEEVEGETSGYASDSVEAPVNSVSLINAKRIDSEMSERTWQNPYCETPETSLPPSGRQSMSKLGELNRQRWGSLWGTEGGGKSDPLPPSWLERGLSRLDHSSQVLVINHDSASSPDSSTTGSTGSESKTYIRGQNIPVDAQVLQEREVRRQRARELQEAIKQQLEEKERQKKVEKERRMREEMEEDERIKRERDKEKERYQEEQRKIREKERAKLKKQEAMREVLATAERKAREDKKQKKCPEEIKELPIKTCSESYCWESPKTSRSSEFSLNLPADNSNLEEASKNIFQENKNHEGNATMENLDGSKNIEDRSIDKSEKIIQDDVRSSKDYDNNNDKNTLRLPIGKEVAIVLSGRIDDTEFFNRSNLQLVNLVVTSPRKNDDTTTSTNSLHDGLNALMKSLGNPVILRKSPRSIVSPRISENRVLTPSKYRNFSMYSRDFGTQTDCESELQDSSSKDNSLKDRKDVVNNNRRDIEKSTNTVVPAEESTMKSLARSKSQPRTSLDSRPRWNANRPGTRYRTQSEKDPHYQRRMRLRRRRVESSDERSRSPSPDRRKSSSQKSKNRNFNRRKVKIDFYDADLSMDSLNSVVPLRIDQHGRVNILPDLKNRNKRPDNDSQNENNDQIHRWCGPEILSQLASLKNGLMSKEREWDSTRCLVSPEGDFY